MNWLVSGSREFPDKKLALAVFRSQFQSDDIVYQGGAQGVDSWAEKVALDKGATVWTYPAEWDKYGKSAGPRRNRQMFDDWYADKDPRIKRALILWDGVSRGTKHMLDLCITVGVPYTLIQSNYD